MSKEKPIIKIDIKETSYTDVERLEIEIAGADARQRKATMGLILNAVKMVTAFELQFSNAAASTATKTIPRSKPVRF